MKNSTRYFLCLSSFLLIEIIEKIELDLKNTGKFLSSLLFDIYKTENIKQFIQNVFGYSTEIQKKIGIKLQNSDYLIFDKMNLLLLAQISVVY